MTGRSPRHPKMLSVATRRRVCAQGGVGSFAGLRRAVEAVLTVQALCDGVVPPTLNLKDLDPEIDLDVVADQRRRGDYRYAITNSFGLGGHNVSLAFGAY